MVFGYSRLLGHPGLPSLSKHPFKSASLSRQYLFEAHDTADYLDILEKQISMTEESSIYVMNC